MTTTHPIDALPALSHRDRRRTRTAAPDTGFELVLSDGDEQRHLPLDRDLCWIGRSVLADITLDDPTVSRRHATLLVQADGVRVLDDTSTNGTFLNGERITVAQARGGDELQFGRVRIVLAGHGPAVG